MHGLVLKYYRRCSSRRRVPIGELGGLRCRVGLGRVLLCRLAWCRYPSLGLMAMCKLGLGVCLRLCVSAPFVFLNTACRSRRTTWNMILLLVLGWCGFACSCRMLAYFLVWYRRFFSFHLFGCVEVVCPKSAMR